MHEGGATIALLEKILREMGTREGDELLVGRLSAVADAVSQHNSITANKLDELLQYVKNTTYSRELTSLNGNGSSGYRSREFGSAEAPRLELDFDQPKVGPMTQRVGALLASNGNKENMRDAVAGRSTDVLSDDILKIIRSVKDSVAHSGGLTAEVKALVRELRGEVLVMGRELGRKLDEAHKSPSSAGESSVNDVAQIVQDGLDDLKEQMDSIVRENRRQSAGSATSRNTVDYQEIFNAMRAALQERDQHHEGNNLNKDEIIDAVKGAWENYKPEIEIQQFGLERDELLAVLKEGMAEYASRDQERDVSATRDEVYDAVLEGLKHFSPPTVETEASLSRDEILDAVRECLEEFEFPSAPPQEPLGPEFTRDDVLGAVREGLQTFDFPANMERQRGSLDDAIRDEVLEAVEEGLRTFDFATAIPMSRVIEDGLTKGDVLDAVKEALDNFDFASHSSNTTALALPSGNTLSRDDVFDAVQAGLRENPSAGNGADPRVIEHLQDIIDTLQTEFRAVSDEAKQNVAAHGRDTEQVLDATKDGFDRLRADMESYVDEAAGISAKDELLDALKENFDALRAEIEVSLSKSSSGSIDDVKSEFEHLRETMATSLVRQGGSIYEKEEILEALREGLDSLRVDIERPRAVDESVVSNTGEILDALQDGLTGIRSEVEKIGNKPVDMTVNYEILDTLKAGMDGLRADIDRLREDGYNDRTVAEVNDKAIISPDSLTRTDIESLEVLITQLRIKVEALENMPPPIPQAVPGSLTKDDLVPFNEALKSVQDSVEAMSAKERSLGDDNITKTDFEAIEILLHNTKAKIDEMDPSQNINKDQLDLIETLLLESKDSIATMSTQMEESVKKEDVNIVEVLVRDIAAALEVVKERATKDDESTEKVTKTDVEAVEAICLDVKAAIELLAATDLATLASKTDIENLEVLVKEVKIQLNDQGDANVKAFEERQAETVGVGERVSEIKTFLEEFKNAMKEKLDEGATSVETLGKLLETLGESITQSASTNDDIKTLSETINTEFEKSHAGVVGAKLEADEKFAKTWETLDKINTTCDGVDVKLEEKFAELLLKYDDAQTAAEAKTKTTEEKSLEIEATMLSTKAVAEELKTFIETFAVTLTDSTDKMDESSKTVFSRVDQTFNRVEETHADAKAEHQLTREQVAKTLGAVEGVQGNVSEYQPKILESLKDVLLIVGQHYEHSKSATSNIQEKIESIPPPAEPIDVSRLLIDAAPEKYDDARVHEKLDKLVDHTHVAGKSFAQLDMLDKIHKQVMDTAAEVSQFVSAQTQRIANDHEDKEKAVEEATLELERKLAQKDSTEAVVASLKEEEEILKESVSILKAEQENLAHQKMRLSADVSSLETALRIRREELQAMEARAEGLERRILEGVIDHSRALLISKTNKGRDAMSRKRVPSRATSTTGSIVSSATSRASYHTQSAVSMAMNGNRSVPTAPITTTANPSRRILSLNQITNNVPNGASAFMKRSQSVKTPNAAAKGLRKSSWGGSLSRHYGELNKENLALKESEEDEFQESETGGGGRDDVSESGTLRRESLGTTILTSTGISESIDEEGTEWTGSMDGDEYSEAPETPMSENAGGSGLVLYEDGQIA